MIKSSFLPFAAKFRGVFLVLFFAISTGMPLRAQVDAELINSGEILGQGAFYYQIGKYGKAASLYNKVGRNDTNYAEVLRDLALTYSEDKEDSLCALTCQRGLTLKSQFEPDFYILLGISLKELGRYDTAVKALDEGMRLYPYSYTMPYQKGMVYFKMKNYPEAQIWFQKSIELNPYNANAHFQLGKTCSEQGRLVPAILSYEYYLMMEPYSERSQKVVSALEDLYSGDMQPDPDFQLDMKEAGDDCFSDIQDLINSQIATTNPAYKNKTKINLKIVKQCQAMLEKLHYEPNTGNWWMENYVPFFVEVQKKNYFVPFVTLSLYAVAANNPSVLKSVKKNKKKINEFSTWANEYIQEHFNHPSKELFKDKDKLHYIFYDNHMVAGAGHVNLKKQPVGEWFYFYLKGGHLLSTGNYDDTGERDGEWRWYYSSGALREVALYEHGLRTGKNEEYHKNGLLAFKGNYVSDKLDGEYELYSIHGGINEKGTMTAGKLNGPATVYYTNGTKKLELNYKMGKLNGEVLVYTIDGKLLRKSIQVNGMRTGKFVEYYVSGQVDNEGDYKNDDRIGAWKFYWDNGKVLREGVYKEKGQREGLWKQYYRDGTLQAETNFKAGKYHGVMNKYDTDGKLYLTATYASDKLKRETFYDKSGKVIADYMLGRETEVTEYYPNGKKSAFGTYYDGMRDGTWKMYSAYGDYMYAKERYRSDYLQGERIEYYANGKVASELNYYYGEADGYMKSWYQNGQLESEGWYVNGEEQGDWYLYNERGIIISHRYYLDGSMVGYQEFFDAKGKKDEEIYFKDEFAWERTRYDSTGKVNYHYVSENGTGRFAPLYSNGQPWAMQEYKNGYLEGPTVRYAFNGTKTLEVNYVNGQQHGPRKEAYDGGAPFVEFAVEYGEKNGPSKGWWENGNKRWEENYYYGDYDGVQKYYHENGQLLKESNWDMGSLVGEMKFYSDSGSLEIVRYYKEGVLIGYSYQDSTGNLVPMIRLVDASGKFTAYYRNGNKSIEGEFMNGRIHGHVIEYYENGTVAEDENFDYGDFEGDQKYYYRNGNLKSETHYYGDEKDGLCKFYSADGKLEHTEYYVLGDSFGTWNSYNPDGSVRKYSTWYDDLMMTEVIPRPMAPAAPTGTPTNGSRPK
jgi:uncharacterized protein